MRQTLPKSTILRGYKKFSKVISEGVCISGTLIFCYVVKEKVSEIQDSRNIIIGFSVPKKRVLLAVHRNRVKRLMREAVRKHLSLLRESISLKEISFQIVVMFKGNRSTDIDTLSLLDFEPEWIDLQQKCEVISNDIFNVLENLKFRSDNW